MDFPFIDELTNSMLLIFGAYFFMKDSPMCLSGSSHTLLTAFPFGFSHDHCSFSLFVGVVSTKKNTYGQTINS
jgi:hypothetical protein